MAQPTAGCRLAKVVRQLNFICRACHAVDQFTERERSRVGWDDSAAEMLVDHGMASPEPWAERLTLDYLAQQFGSKQSLSLRRMRAELAVSVRSAKAKVMYQVRPALFVGWKT